MNHSIPSRPDPTRGKVSLVGAGPGVADLITVRGQREIQAADVIIYDKLIDERLLDLAPSHVEKIYVGKVASHHCVPQDRINDLLIEHAKAGKRVVRLKGGDPLLFARGGEEAIAVTAANIALEIIPGVTAALAVAATTSVPLTHRGVASAVLFVTGHEDPSKPNTLDWSSLAQFPGTLVIYMALTRIGSIGRELIRLGKSGDTSVLLVEWGGTNRQRTFPTTLADLAADYAIPLSSPVLAVIGECCPLRERMGWFEQRPLFGKTVLVPRAAGQADETARTLESLGASVICEPVFDILAPDDWTPVDDQLSQLRQYDWLVFTSGNGVRFFLRRLLERGYDLRHLGNIQIAAIGPGTAAALAEFHLRADLVPEEYRAESLADKLAGRVKDKCVLLARADRGRPVLYDQLCKVSQQVTQVTVYRQIDRPAPSDATQQLLRSGVLDYVLLSSSNMATGLFRWLDEPARQILRERTRLVSISPVTTQRIIEEGFTPSIEATTFTLAGMIDAMLENSASS